MSSPPHQVGAPLLTSNQQSLAFAVIGPHAQHHLFTPDPVEALIFQQATVVLPIRRQPWATNEPPIKPVAANFKGTVKETVEPIGPWVHAAAIVEM